MGILKSASDHFSPEQPHGPDQTKKRSAYCTYQNCKCETCLNLNQTVNIDIDSTTIKPKTADASTKVNVNIKTVNSNVPDVDTLIVDNIVESNSYENSSVSTVNLNVADISISKAENVVLANNTEQPHGLNTQNRDLVDLNEVTDFVELSEVTLSNLKILSLNVCGLKSKLKITEFCSTCQQYDVVILCETKLDDLDSDVITVALDNLGFVAFQQNREKVAIHRAGGVLVAIKSSYAKMFNRVKCIENFLVVLKSTNIKLESNKQLLLVAAYIPPYGSRYSSLDLFHSLSDVLLNYDSSTTEILLCGDLNAHTLLKNDIIDFDDDLLYSLDLDQMTVDFLQNKQSLIELGLPVTRGNKDTKPDKGGYGEALLELCRNHLLCFFNGRAGNDKGIGKVTTIEDSLIDYVIGSSYLLSCVTSFTVADFDPIYSDKHCMIQVELQLMQTPQMIHEIGNNQLSHIDLNECYESAFNDKYVICRWSSERIKGYEDTIVQNSLKIADITSRAPTMTVSAITNEINNIMLDAAISALGQRPKHGIKMVGPNKTHLSLNENARQCRKAYHKAKQLNNRLKTNETRQELINRSKEYKKCIKDASFTQRMAFTNKLRTMKSANPKLYWNMLNSKKKDNPPIPLKELYDHFRKVSEGDPDNFVNQQDSQISLADLDTECLNSPFTAEEIEKRVKFLKNGKSAGCDGILNEYIKHSYKQLMPLYVSLFIKILQEGQIPEDWLLGLIVPLYKNKGDAKDSNNYRGITLLSCVGKLFTSVLNSRLYDFCESNNILKELQAGFRSGYSTNDHIFLLQGIVELFINRKKKLFTAFIDYAKAFDTVSREALWHKLLTCGINGKILDVIRSLFTNIKSCVYMNGTKSEYFASLKGVRQGENLSPLLFSLFVNDMEEFMLSSGCEYIKSGDHELDCLMKLLVVMYADDTIILADSPQGLQDALHALAGYCDKWQLNVNCSKTKVMVFSKRKYNTKNLSFKYRGEPLEVVHHFKYLGVTVSYNISFKQCIQELNKQATRAMYALLAKSRALDLPVDIQLHLFDSLVAPILLYGCEVWGHQRVDSIEKLHLKFLKYVLGVKLSTCNSIVYGELGRFPLIINLKKRIIGFYARTLAGKKEKLSHIICRRLITMHNEGTYLSKWTSCVRNILNECGLSNIWDNQQHISVEWLKNTVQRSLQDQFFQSWSADLDSKSSCDFYVQYKKELRFEKYLNFNNKKVVRAIVQFRTNNCRIPKVTGRYRNLPRRERLCNLCKKGQVGDEYHILIECNHDSVKIARERYLPKCLFHRPSVHKCAKWIQESKDRDTRSLKFFYQWC